MAFEVEGWNLGCAKTHPDLAGTICANRFADSQRRRNDTTNKICVLEGVGEGKNLRKIL